MESYVLSPVDWVEVGNRTSKLLTVTYDGKQWTLPPYPKTVAMPRIVAEAACRQHPVMGTEDPYSPQLVDLLVYVVGNTKFDATPIEQSTALERLDRSQLAPDAQVVQVISGGRRVVERTDAGLDSIFAGGS